MIKLKSKAEILKMQESARVVASTLSFVKSIIRPGLSTLDIERAGLDYLNSQFPSVKPAFKGYMGFPAAFCISINEEVVHGIPKKEKIIQNGDIVSIDFGVLKDSYYGDSAISVIAGEDIHNYNTLLRATEDALLLGIDKARVGNTLADIGRTIENHVKKYGYSVVRDFVGHGIGRELHEDPQVPNFYTSYADRIKLKKGLVIAIEPMVNMGTYAVKILSDKWTVVSNDSLPSAHFEHTIAITDTDPIILTRRD